jgi:hypothetical protein
MTAKDYRLIADVLANTLGACDTPQPVRHNAVFTMADRLQADNPRFDRARFLSACGVE